MADTDRDRIRVLVVDDEPDLRALIRTVLDLDGRYEVVGEAGDGEAGIALAAELQPELVVLDKSMPTLGGLEALPRVQAAAPAAQVILYTAEYDEQVHQAAIAGGAAGVLTKDGSSKRLAALVSDALLRRWHDDEREGVAVTVGPVPSDAALDWVESSTRVIEAVGTEPSLADVGIGADVVETFCRYLDSWRVVAEASDEFLWTARASLDDVTHLLEAWSRIDAVETSRLEALGLSWSSPRGRAFKAALTAAVLEVLRREDALHSLTERLGRQWEAPPA